ncbi:MAG: hypothetical protein NXI15_09375 [Gammaproteobacteria bacterium]|nr:hypothetical protein [Gammaproteobacteria bacterium]
MTKIAFLTLILVTVASCKLNVISPRGGEVQSVASGTCLEKTVCVHDISDTTYTETFTAVPAQYFSFVRWNSGANFFCGDSTDPVCVVDSSVLAGFISDSAIDEYQDVYLMPIFTDQLEITDIVIADGKEWVQTSLFQRPSGLDNNAWASEIFAVCPEAAGGVCSGSLQGYSMSGWTFASFADITALFNSFIPGAPLGPEPYLFNFSTFQPWARAPLDAGFLGFVDPVTGGYSLSAMYREIGGTAGVVQWVATSSPGRVVTFSSIDPLYNQAFPAHGAFFYRTPSP